MHYRTAVIFVVGIIASSDAHAIRPEIFQKAAVAIFDAASSNKGNRIIRNDVWGPLIPPPVELSPAIPGALQLPDLSSATIYTPYMALGTSLQNHRNVTAEPVGPALLLKSDSAPGWAEIQLPARYHGQRIELTTSIEVVAGSASLMVVDDGDVIANSAVHGDGFKGSASLNTKMPNDGPFQIRVRIQPDTTVLVKYVIVSVAER